MGDRGSAKKEKNNHPQGRTGSGTPTHTLSIGGNKTKGGGINRSTSGKK